MSGSSSEKTKRKDKVLTMNQTQKMIPIGKLHPFENHLYKVQDNEEMEQLAESIRQNGLLAPILVRPVENTTDE